MHRFALPLLAIALPLPALAAEIAVEDFGAMTRITIPVTPEKGWTVDREAKRLVFRGAAADTRVTAPNVTAGGRLSGIVVATGRDSVEIRIDLACDCDATHFGSGNGVVIVDVSESLTIAPVETVDIARGWVSAQVQVEQAPAAPRSTPLYYDTPTNQPTAARPLPIAATSPPVRAPLTPRQTAAQRSDSLATAPAPRRKPPAPARRAPAAQDVVRSQDEAIDALREKVLETLALGVEQGRITMDSDGSGAGQTYIPAGCPDEAALDLKRLTGGMSNFRDGLPALRAGVYDEMKQVNPAAVRQLARHFLSFGLGEETRNVIDAFQTVGPPERLILEMARVLEGQGRMMAESILLKPGCGPHAAVWGASVAAEQGAGDVRERFDTAREAIYDVPDPLRKILGARIALGLIDEGDRDGAMRLWRNLQTAQGPRTPEMRLLAAYAIEGDTLLHLLALSETRSLAAVEAATRAAAMLLERSDLTRAERLGKTLADLSFVYHGSHEEEALSLAFARLQARYGDLASALTVLAEKAQDQPERAQYWRSIAHETIRDATTIADPIARPRDFDTILASLNYLDDTRESDVARYSLARKLMNIGAAHIVETVLPAPVLKRSEEAQRLMAEAKLLMGDAPAARALLANLRDDESRALSERTEEIIATRTVEAARALFDPTPSAPAEPSISAARDLIEDAQTDLSIIKELLADG